MTAKSKKTSKRNRPGTIARLRASVEDDLLNLAEEHPRGQARWSRPRKQRVSLRVDAEVVDWLKSLGPGYQTRINLILRKLMLESKKRTGQR